MQQGPSDLIGRLFWFYGKCKPGDGMIVLKQVYLKKVRHLVPIAIGINAME